MMDELTLAIVDSPDCPVSEHIAIFLASGDAPEIPIDSRTVSGFSEGLMLLEGGEFDLVAMPARLLHGRQTEMLAAGCEVGGARVPRRPNLVLVSKNKIGYQPKSAIILSDSKLVRRQLRRARRGLRILGPTAFAAIGGLDAPPSDPVPLAEWMEELRQNEEIDGYITSRRTGHRGSQTRSSPGSQGPRGRPLPTSSVRRSGHPDVQKEVSNQYLGAAL